MFIIKCGMNLSVSQHLSYAKVQDLKQLTNDSHDVMDGVNSAFHYTYYHYYHLPHTLSIAIPSVFWYSSEPIIYGYTAMFIK